MLKLKDKNKKLIAGLINYKDLCIESTLSTGDKKLSFSLHKEDKFYNLIEEECYIETKTQEYVIKARDVGVDYTRFDCVLNLETLEANVFDRFESVEQTITNAFNLAIVGTGWTVKDNTLKKKRTVRCTNKNALEIVQEIKKTYRVDIVFNTLSKQIEVYEHLGEDKGAYFIDSLNLTALQVQSDSYKFATRIIAEGKDNLTFEDINGGKNYVENFQYSKKIKTIYWKDERYTIKESLLEDAKAKLEEISKPFVSYNASILNLAELNPRYKNILDYKLGDTITLISRNNKVKDKQRIVKTLEYPQDHSRDTVELANAILKFEDIQQENQETTDTVNNITTDNGTVDGSTIDSIQVKQIEDFKANVIQVTNLHALNVDIDYLKVNKADMQDVNIVKAKIGTLETTKANITELNSLKATLQQAIITKADITDLNSAVGKINVLESKTASIDNLLSQKASINDLNALNSTISEALIKKATIAQLEALETKTNNLIADKANISDLNSTNANINSLKTDTSNIKTLLNGNLSSENIQTGGITSDKLTISDGFIKDAMIDSINVNKLNAGVLTTDKFNIRSRDGNLIIKDNTIQIKDSSKVRVQVGKDDSGDYSLYVWDKLGNLMFNALGITKDAIKDKIIRNDMVSDDAAIEGKKLNIESVIREVNNGKSNLKASKIDIDTKGQTLDIAFSNLVTENGKNKEEIVSLITKLNVQQGQINASIENSKVLEGKQKNLEDNYNRTVVTVDSLKNTIGSHKTLIDSATGKIISVEVKANTLEKDLSGLTQTVTDTKKVIENNKTSLESKNAELKANIDKVSSSLSSVYNTVDKNNKTLVSKTNTLEQTLNGLAQTVSSNKSTTDGKISNVENVTHELKTGLSGLTSKLDTLKSSTDGINKTVINQGSVINQLQDSIKLKVDSSTFNKSTSTINNNINNLNSDLVSKINSSLSTAKSYSDSKKQEAINSSNSHADAKANESLNNAKAYTNAQVNTVNSNLSKATSEINILKNQISTKVSQSDIDKSIQNITIGGRNLLGNSNFLKDTEFTDTTPTLIGWLREENEGVHSNYNGRLLFINNNGDKVGDSYTSIGLGCSVKENTDYTLSFDYLGAGGFKNQDASSSYIWAEIADGTNIPIRINHPTISDKVRRRYSQTFTFPKGTTKISIRTGFVSISYAWMCFDGFKLEEGNKATDWTPAPEDIGQEIKDNITTVTTKISNVESNLIQKTDSITQRVNQVESTTNSLNGKITSNTNRISNAESKITPTAIINSVNNSIGSGGVIKGVSTILDKNKFTVMDTDNSKIEMQKGAIAAYNNSGKKTYYLDDGEIGICAKDNSDPLGILTSVYKTSASNDTLGNNQSFTTPGGHGFKGVGLLAGDYAGYLTLGYDSVWGVDDKYLEFFRCHKAGWVHMGTVLNFSNEYGIRNIKEINRGNVAELFLNKLHIDQNCINTNATNSKNLWLNYGLGYDCWKANATNDVNVRIGNGYNNGSHGNLVCQSLWVHGNKHRIVDCGDLGFIGMEAYETSTPYFGDIGNAKINEDGICYIIFDREFMEVCDTRTNYKVDISIVSEDLNSKVQVAKKFEDKVKIIGTPGTEFDYEIKAVQKGVDIKRFKRIDEERSDKTNYSINDNVKKLTSKYNNEINPDDGLMKDIELQRSFNLKRTINQLDKKTNKAMEMLNYTKGLKLNGKF